MRCIRASSGVFFDLPTPISKKLSRTAREREMRLRALLKDLRNPYSIASTFYKQIFSYFYVLPLVTAYKELLRCMSVSLVSGLVGVDVVLVQRRPGFSARTILRKLSNKFGTRKSKVGTALYYGLRLLKRYTRLGYIKGYKLLFSGRFTRRDRATYV